MSTTTGVDAIALARDVVSRVAAPDVLDAAVAASRRDTTLPRGVGWRPHTLASGHVGIALLLAAADARWPGEGWDQLGHRHLVTGSEGLVPADASLFTGLAGAGLTATALAAGRERYARFLGTIDGALLPRVRRAVRDLDAVDGCPFGVFDLISGLTGTAVYLLARHTDPDADPDVGAVLRAVLTGLARLLADEREPRRWHTPAGMAGEAMNTAYPGGSHNCGLAHGVTGPLALLALATRDGVRVDGQADGIAAAAAWLAARRVDTAEGPDWPSAVGLDGGPEPGSHRRGRGAWCYGTPGVARALWLAGDALGVGEYRDLALRSVLDLARRSSSGAALASPTFCHGTAGLLAVMRRFARDSAPSADVEAAVSVLTVELAAAHEPSSVLGYRNVELEGVRVDHPGLLDGAPGVALALLEHPVADRLFLLA